MKILVIGTLYEPDLGPSAPLFTLLSENLAARGHQVTVITMVPHYPSGQVAPEFRGRLFTSSTANGVRVIRIGLPSVDRAKLPLRFIQYFCYQIGAAAAGLGQTYDVVLAANPFLTVWLPFAVTVALRGKPAVYSVQDVYPQVGIALGVFRTRPVIAAATFLERFCLNHSGIVQIISESFRAELRQLGVSDEKMALVYNWVDTGLIRPLPRPTAFEEEQMLAGKFIVLYAGNIGRSQGLEHILTAADILRGHADIRFVFVGDGAARAALQVQAEQRRLPNVQFIPFQPRRKLPEVLASADIALVSLSKGIGPRSLPSKIYSIYASGRPALASVEEDCETWNLVRRSGAGVCIPPEDPGAMAEAILMLKNDPRLREELGQRGRAWAEKYHSPQAAAAQFEALLQAASMGRAARDLSRRPEEDTQGG